MSWIDDLLKQDEIDDAREKSYLREHLEEAQNARLTDEDLQFVLDAIVEYYATSDVLDQAPDKNGEITIDGEAIAAYVIQKAQDERHSPFNPEDIIDIVALDMDYDNE
jgi:hypothetical protein